MKVRWTVRLTRLTCLSAVAMVIAACGTSTHPAAVIAPTRSATPASRPATVSPVPAAAAPVSTAAPASSAPAATEIIAYSPYMNDLPRPGLAVSAPVSVASCSASQDDLEPLRCIPPAGTIYDPCFPNSAGTSCLYVASPTATAATRVILGPPTPPQPITGPPISSLWPGYHPTVPWAIELSDGTICVYSHGAEELVNGLRPEDGCADGRFLFGDPTESAARWSVQVGASIAGPVTGSTPIDRAWIFAATGP